MYQTVPNGMYHCKYSVVPSDTIRLIPTIPLVPSLSPIRIRAPRCRDSLAAVDLCFLAAQQPARPITRVAAFGFTGDSGFSSLVSIVRKIAEPT